ncbi:hypothetical protein BV25DRAFT_1633306 [Artomyces pyxidatus]|uniref:Uncharacterized protein n=1 Tax=Artomyces pyxidatus TaxID=48021 RepID=A0ACB8SIP0_9AGAM|nr:hypothetical protein BV25DRAFT_1633306 [Artomyces pyxidatus]
MSPCTPILGIYTIWREKFLKAKLLSRRSKSESHDSGVAKHLSHPHRSASVGIIAVEEHPQESSGNGQVAMSPLLFASCPTPPGPDALHVKPPATFSPSVSEATSPCLQDATNTGRISTLASVKARLDNGHDLSSTATMVGAKHCMPTRSPNLRQICEPASSTSTNMSTKRKRRDSAASKKEAHLDASPPKVNAISEACRMPIVCPWLECGEVIPNHLDIIYHIRSRHNYCTEADVGDPTTARPRGQTSPPETSEKLTQEQRLSCKGKKRRMIEKQPCQFPNCDKPIRADNLSRHIRETHYKVKVACAGCSSSFTRKDRLDKHVKRCKAKKSVKTERLWLATETKKSGSFNLSSASCM